MSSTVRRGKSGGQAQVPSVEMRTLNPLAERSVFADAGDSRASNPRKRSAARSLFRCKQYVVWCPAVDYSYASCCRLPVVLDFMEDRVQSRLFTVRTRGWSHVRFRITPTLLTHILPCFDF